MIDLGSVTYGLVGLGCIKKQATSLEEQAFLHDLCFSSWLDFSALTSRSDGF